MEPIINLQSGSIFKIDQDVFMKLRNPEIPKLANISNYSVWAADIGNGHIKKFNISDQVVFVGNCFNLIGNKI